MPGPEERQPRRRVLVFGAIGGVVLVAVVVAVLSRIGDDEAPADVRVSWGATDGQPSCVYHPEDDEVTAQIAVAGTSPEADVVTVTVTAYEDEDTSQPVGSSDRSVTVEGTLDLPVLLTIPVERPPYVDIDGVAACRLSVSSESGVARVAGGPG